MAKEAATPKTRIAFTKANIISNFKAAEIALKARDFDKVTERLNMINIDLEWLVYMNNNTSDES